MPGAPMDSFSLFPSVLPSVHLDPLFLNHDNPLSISTAPFLASDGSFMSTDWADMACAGFDMPSPMPPFGTVEFKTPSDESELYSPTPSANETCSTPDDVSLKRKSLEEFSMAEIQAFLTRFSVHGEIEHAINNAKLRTYPLNPKHKKQERITRPPNAFILFRRDNMARLKQEYPHLRVTELSTIAGIEWRQARPGVQHTYRNMAAELRAEHHERHPGYKFTPRKRTK